MTPGGAVPVFQAAWSMHVEAFTQWMRASGSSVGTIRLRTHYLHMCAAMYPDPLTLTADDLVVVLAHPLWAGETRRSARATLRLFFTWLVESERRRDNPAARLPRVRLAPPRPRPAPEATLRAALDGADPRTRLMLMLAAYAGLRCAEIAQLHADDLALDEIRVHGKGGRVRYVPVHPSLRARLRGDAGGWVFPNGYGSHVSAGHVTRLLSRALGPGVTAHQLRHLFACRVYSSQRDLLAVQQLLGHASVATTQRYTRPPADALRAAVDSISYSEAS